MQGDVQPRMRYLTWLNFDAAVTKLAAALWPHVIRGEVKSVYGEPRGGLPLAVALSHRLRVPLANDLVEGDGVVWVDDIVDSGAAMAAARKRRPGVLCVAWVTRQKRRSLIAANCLPNVGWIVFPWEVPAHAVDELTDYEARHVQAEG